MAHIYETVCSILRGLALPIQADHFARPWEESSGRGLAAGNLSEFADAVGRDAADAEALGAAALAGNDFNSREGHLQMLGQEPAQGFVGAAFDRRGREARLQRALPLAFDSVAAGPDGHPDREARGAIALFHVDHRGILVLRPGNI